MWERKASMESGGRKNIGTLVVTNKRLCFKPILSRKNIEIKFEEIKELQTSKNKKLEVRTLTQKYILLIRDAEKIAHLINSFLFLSVKA